MTLKQAFEVAYFIMKTMKNGEIRLLVRNGEIKYVNRVEEVFWKDIPPTSF